MNNKAFGNIFCNSQKSFHTSPKSSDSNNRGYRPFSKLNNGICIYKNPRIFCKCKCHCWVWRMVDSLYYSSRKISERCENSFLDYRIYYQKLCYLMRQITKDLNWPIVSGSAFIKCIIHALYHQHSGLQYLFFRK